MNLDGKVAIVSGGASGIGLATSRRLADEGVSIVVLDVDRAGGEAAAKQLGGRFVHGDVADASRWEVAVREAEAAYGGVDIAQLNPGVTSGVGAIEEMSDEQFQRTLRTNIDGVAYGIRAVVPAMKRRGGGSVVVTSAIAAVVAFPPDPIYALTKHAVIGLIRSLVPQLRDAGITINAVCPADPVDTAMVGEAAKAALLAAGVTLMAPGEIADAAYGCLTGHRTGEAWICNAGRAPFAHTFPDATL